METRYLFLIPDLSHSIFTRLREWLSMTRFRRFLMGGPMVTSTIYGGTLNIMRHCAVARSVGIDASLATVSGRDTYGEILGLPQLPFVRLGDHRESDVLIVADIFTYLIPTLRGCAIAYEQSPYFVRNDFDHRSPRVRVWTDSPYMRELCVKAYPGIDVPIIPNVVDEAVFQFVPQSQRESGALIAFPRKGPDFIEQTWAEYQALGGRYWRLELVDGLPLEALAQRFRAPQAFLASAEVEGCALPPQEAMASGILVIGRNAGGANFSMIDRQTALVGNTPEAAARALVEAEDAELRERLTSSAYEFIQRFFPRHEPTEHWRAVLRSPPFATL